MLLVTLVNGVFVGTTLFALLGSAGQRGAGIFPDFSLIWIYSGCWLIPACLALSVPATVVCEWLARGFLRNEPFVSWLLTFAMVGMTFGGGLGAVSILLIFADPDFGGVVDQLTLVSAIAGMITGLTSALILAPIWYQYRANTD